MRILGISGSLRRDSHNTRLLRAATRELPPSAELVVWDRLKAVVPYDTDDDVCTDLPASVLELHGAIADADALLLATPEYNHSIPGQLKNALDWLSRPAGESILRGVPTAVVGASTGAFGAVWAQAEVRKVLAATGARVIDAELPVANARQAFAGDGSLADPGLRDRLAGLVDQLVGEAERALVPA